MINRSIAGGVVHKLPSDLQKALLSDPKILEVWTDITPLARNEWICWIESAKKQKTMLLGWMALIVSSILYLPL